MNPRRPRTPTCSILVAAFITAAPLVLTACAGPSDSAPATTDTKTMPSAFAEPLLRTVVADGRRHVFAVYVPADYETLAQRGPLPLIVFLHGRGECGDDGLKQTRVGLFPAVRAHPQRWPCIIVMPQKPGNDDTWLEHDRLVTECIADVRRNWSIDPERLSLTGLSQGGAGTWALAAEHPRRWSAIAPVCGFVHAPGAVNAIRFGSDDERERIARVIAQSGIPTWAFHGAADDVIRQEHSDRMAEAIRAAGGRVDLTIYPECNHNSWDAAYGSEGFAEWLLSHRRRGAEAPE